MKLHKSNLGQAQILLISGLGIVLTTSALFTLDRAKQGTLSSIKNVKKHEMIFALDHAIKIAQHLYELEANCDPYLLDIKLDKVRMDGSIETDPTVFHRRAMNVKIYDSDQIKRWIDPSEIIPYNPPTFRVQFGPVTRIRWAADPLLGTYQKSRSQDAVIEVWTTGGDQRIVQRAALINTCSYTCVFPIQEGSNVSVNECALADEPEVAYGYMNDPSSRMAASGADTTCSAGLVRQRGQVKGNPANPGVCDATMLRQVNVRDLRVFNHTLRTKQVSGACEDAILPGPGIAPDRICGDLNRDQRVNDVDLGIMEKLLRGYLNTAQTHY